MKFLKDAWYSLRGSTSSWSYRPNCRRLPIHGRTQNLLWPLLFLLLLMTSTWRSASSMRSCWCWRTAISYCIRSLSGSSNFWCSSSRHDQQESMSSPIRVEGKVMRGWGGTRLYNPWPHARNTLEERWARWACVRSTLGVRSWCARCALELSRRTHNACPACAPRVSGVSPARSAHLWRPSGVYIHASSSAHIFVHAKKSRRTQRTTTNA